MLKIYSYKPSNNYIENNEAFFLSNTISKLVNDTEALSKVAALEGLDIADTVANKYHSVLGTYASLEDISTGSKTYANILLNPSRVFNVRECGRNAMYAIYSLSEGRIYDTFIHSAFIGETKFIGVTNEGETSPKTLYEVEEWFNEVCKGY